MIDAAVQNGFSLAKLTNEPQINMYRLRECWIEKLGSLTTSWSKFSGIFRKSKFLS